MSPQNLLTGSDAAAWQKFVELNPECGVYHHLGWQRAINRSYGHAVPYLYSKTDQGIRGILPLVLIKSSLFGTTLTSLPFVDFAGIVSTSAEARDELISRTTELGSQLRADYIELRQRSALPVDLPDSSHKILMKLKLAADEDQMWSALSSERRNRIRRAQKAGLSVDIKGVEALATFYEIWSWNMRDLGSPPHSFRFFKCIFEELAEHCSILLVRYEQRYIGAALGICYKDTMYVPWVSSLREFFNLYPNNILYWEAIRFAISRGLEIFDFGRSTIGSGTFDFKQRWGAKGEPLHWYALSGAPRLVTETAESARSRIATALWKKLPVGASRWIGPAIRKNITA